MVSIVPFTRYPLATQLETTTHADSTAQQAAAELRELHLQLAALEVAHQEAVAQLRVAMAEPEATLQRWFEQNKTRLQGKLKSFELWGVKFGLRKKQDELVLDTAKDFDEVKQAIERGYKLRHLGLLTTPAPTLDKKALRKACADDPALARRLGVRLLPGGDEFFAQPTLHEPAE